MPKRTETNNAMIEVMRVLFAIFRLFSEVSSASSPNMFNNCAKTERDRTICSWWVARAAVAAAFNSEINSAFVTCV